VALSLKIFRVEFLKALVLYITGRVFENAWLRS
jgi:hypothetical protein